MNRNFVEMLSALFDADADYLIVGAYALAAHGKQHPVIGKEELIRNKQALGRAKDLLDVDELRKVR